MRNLTTQERLLKKAFGKSTPVSHRLWLYDVAHTGSGDDKIKNLITNLRSKKRNVDRVNAFIEGISGLETIEQKEKAYQIYTIAFQNNRYFNQKYGKDPLNTRLTHALTSINPRIQKPSILEQNVITQESDDGDYDILPNNPPSDLERAGYSEQLVPSTAYGFVNPFEDYTALGGIEKKVEFPVLNEDEKIVRESAAVPDIFLAMSGMPYESVVENQTIRRRKIDKAKRRIGNIAWSGIAAMLFLSLSSFYNPPKDIPKAKDIMSIYSAQALKSAKLNN